MESKLQELHKLRSQMVEYKHIKASIGSCQELISEKQVLLEEISSARKSLENEKLAVMIHLQAIEADLADAKQMESEMLEEISKETSETLQLKQKDATKLLDSINDIRRRHGLAQMLSMQQEQDIEMKKNLDQQLQSQTFNSSSKKLKAK